VSFCLTGNAAKHKIKAETSERIVAYAEKVGFTPNAMARNLVKGQNNTVGLLMRQGSGVEKSFGALNKAMRMLNEAGREFVFQSCLNSELASAVRTLKGMGVKDIIMFGPFSPVGYKKFYYDDYKKLIPLLRNINFYMVDYSFSNSARLSQSTYHLGINQKKFYLNLFDIMHKKHGGAIVCDENCVSLEDFAEYHKKNGLAFDKAQHLFVDSEIEDLLLRGKQIAAQVLELHKRLPVKTVILHNDEQAISLIDTLLQHGIKVPEDISVIGYNNISLSPYVRIPLTTVAVPIEKHVDIVMSAILKGEKISHDTESQPQIIWRESARKF
jgi:DNA-binding LacI/PurR family transcriptional regulator